MAFCFGQYIPQQEQQFFLTLPSNTVDPGNRHVESDEKNRQSDFRVILPQRVVLGMDWEIALAEIIYPHSWFNIRSEDGEDSTISYFDYSVSSGGKIKVEPGCYDKPMDLLSIINLAFLNISTATGYQVPFQIGYSEVSKRAYLKRKPDTEIAVKMGRKIQYMLGFDKKDFKFFRISERTQVFATYPMDLRAGFDALYVYCNLVRNQVIGDCLAPLLRVVPVEGKPDDIICRTYNLPHYLPLDRTEFDAVEISIKDDCNNSVPFLYGKVIVKLHFRKKKFLL